MVSPHFHWPQLKLPARIFVYEHVSGGGMASAPLPGSLRVEGQAMLQAMLQDLDRLPGVEVVATLDARLESRELPGEVHPVARATEGQRLFRQLAGEAQGTLVIAPEIGGCLQHVSETVLDAGGLLLGADPRGVEVAGDKVATAVWLERAGVPCVATRLLSEAPRDLPGPVVVKPRHGAGSEGVRLHEALPWVSDARGGDAVVSPYVDGLAASVLVIVGRSRTVPLLACRQHLSRDGRFAYLGGALPLPDAEAARASSLARRAVESLPGLRGFAGVDLILSRSGADGDRVIEVNPRLTTSYCGLRRAARSNLAACWLDAWTGKGPGEPEWSSRCLRFGRDGSVRFEGSPHAACRT